MEVETIRELVATTRKFEIENLKSITTDIESLLPHRKSMLLLGELLGISIEENTLRAQTKISDFDPIFEGHFPGDPVYPGVLQVEMISQAGVCLVKLMSGIDDADSKNIKVRAIRLLYSEFSQEVKPGDTLNIEVKSIEVTPWLSTFGGRIIRDKEVCAIAIVEVYIGT